MPYKHQLLLLQTNEQQNIICDKILLFYATFHKKMGLST